MRDEINDEIGRRRVHAVVDRGAIGIDELMNAPIVMLICPTSATHPLTDDGELCAVCGAEPVDAV